MKKSTTKSVANSKAAKKVAKKSKRVVRSGDAKIHVEVKANPFRKGSSRAKAFSRIRNGMTVAAAAKAVGRRLLGKMEYHEAISIH